MLRTHSLLPTRAACTVNMLGRIWLYWFRRHACAPHVPAFRWKVGRCRRASAACRLHTARRNTGAHYAPSRRAPGACRRHTLQTAVRLLKRPAGINRESWSARYQFLVGRNHLYTLLYLPLLFLPGSTYGDVAHGGRRSRRWYLYTCSLTAYQRCVYTFVWKSVENSALLAYS